MHVRRLVFIELKYSNRLEKFFTNPIIAAVRDENNLQKAIESKVSSIFLLTGNTREVVVVLEMCHEKVPVS